MPMPKPWFGLLTGAIFCTTSVQAIAQVKPALSSPKTPTQPATQPTAAAITLTLQDLPPGFQEIPAGFKSQLATRIEPIKQLFTKANLSLDDFFAFVNPNEFQLVLGFTGKMPNLTQQRLFDTTIQQVQQQAFRQQLGTQIQQQLPQNLGVQLLEYRLLPQFANIGDASAGITLALDSQFGRPLRVDFGGFRRNSVGAFTAVVYFDRAAPVVTVKDVATKLDDRILQYSAANTDLRRRSAIASTVIFGADVGVNFSF